MIWITTLLALVAWILAGLLVLATAYRAVLLLASFRAGAGTRPAAEAAQAATARFAVLIPAHDEDLLIGDAIRSIRAARYPQQAITIHVVADNCSDRTAARVREHGEIALERSDASNPGKGQALDWALGRIRLDDFDAIAFFDADNLVDPGFFEAMHDELAVGGRCLQGTVDIANPSETRMTRLLAITYVMKNRFFNGGKRGLGLSVLLMGTGMVFRREVIERTGWVAMRIGEDLEQSFALVEAGETIRFVPRARTATQESSTLEQGTTQRQRWASGRRELNPVARRSIIGGLRDGSAQRVDLGIDLLMPSYAKLANASLLGLALALLLRGTAPALLPVMGAVWAYQALEIVLALALGGGGFRGAASLAFAPVFLVWRGVIDLWAAVGGRPGGWVRTGRARHVDHDGNEAER